MEITVKIIALMVVLNISLTMSSAKGLNSRINFPLTNKQALDRYRLGWASGDIQIIMDVVNNSSFTFTWVPENNVVTAEDFPQFFEQTIHDVEATTNKKYLMAFDSIIQRDVSGSLFETADWIIEGFARGSYFSSARNGVVTWDMATVWLPRTTMAQLDLY